MDKMEQIKQLVSEINRLHLDFSNDYFETKKIEKINLSKTVAHVPAPHVYKYRLNFHESVNDYLMTANIDIKYFYRVKTRESIDDKMARFAAREDQYPVNNWLNDIFGVRIILSADEINLVMDLLDDWQEELGLKSGICARKKVIAVCIFILKIKAIFIFRGSCKFGMPKTCRATSKTTKNLSEILYVQNKVVNYPCPIRT